MIKIDAIIKPYSLEAVRESLDNLGVKGMTVSEVRGFGRQKGQAELYRGAEYAVDFVPKVKIEIVLEEDLADKAVEAIASAARTGKIGDGKIFMYPMNDIMRIRTGERGAEAIKNNQVRAAAKSPKGRYSSNR